MNIINDEEDDDDDSRVSKHYCFTQKNVSLSLRDPQLGQKKAAGGSDSLDGKDRVNIIRDTDGFLEKENNQFEEAN